MGRIDEKLQDIADRIKNMGSTQCNNEKAQAELVGEIRAVVNSLQVSNDSRAGFVTHITNQPSLLHLHPPHLANYLHQHRGSSLDAASWSK